MAMEYQMSIARPLSGLKAPVSRPNPLGERTTRTAPFRSSQTDITQSNVLTRIVSAECCIALHVRTEQCVCLTFRLTSARVRHGKCVSPVFARSGRGNHTSYPILHPSVSFFDGRNFENATYACSRVYNSRRFAQLAATLIIC